METMPDKGITNAITYNFLNLPTQIDQNTNTTTYLYRADGVKLKKTYNLVNAAGSKIINTEYLDGFQYSTPNIEPIRNALQEQDEVTMSIAQAGNEEAFAVFDDRLLIPGNPPGEIPLTLSFFPTAEGFYDYENLRYIYQYKDHLGNVRVSYVQNSEGDLEIMDTNDYYPFGMSFIKNNTNSYYDPMAIPYNYKYNGKELQETGMYDYGWRHYMPDVGRWMQLDPLVEDTEDPYAYVYNNPISLTDPDGRAPDDGDESCCKNLQGFLSAVVDNVTGVTNLVGKYNDGSTSYKNGVLSGNIASVVAGAIIAADGTTKVVGGTAGLVTSGLVSTTGVGAVAGGPGAVVSGGVIVTGAVEGVAGSWLMSNASKNMQSNKNSGNSSTKNNSSNTSNKVEKSKTTTTVGKEGKYTKTTEVRPSKQSPGQSRAEYTRVKNKDGKVIKTYKDSYDRANNFQHRKPLTGGPEGR
jgi:RHS repeat-associated protein